MSGLETPLDFPLGGGGESADGYAGMLEALLPQGKLRRLAGSVLSKLLLGSADELARVDDRVGDMLNEADPSTATELLPEYELELGLTAAATIEERRANVVARLVRRQRFRPADFRQALAPLLGQAAVDVVVLERSRAFVISIGDDREIYRFFIYRDPGLPGPAFIASAQAMVTEMKPSHTIGTVIESVCALYDDEHSLYDRDLLGVTPSFVSASAPVTTRSTSLTVAAPAGTAAGDTVLCFVWANNINFADVDVASLPGGWSVLSRVVTATNQLALLLRRVATGSEPASHTLTCTHDGSHYLTGQCLAYRALETTAALAAAVVTDRPTPSTSFISPAAAAAAVSDAVVGFAIANDNTVTSTAPAGTVERVNQSATQDGFSHVEVFDLVSPQVHGSGSVGPFTTTLSATATGVAATYVLRAQFRMGV